MTNAQTLEYLGAAAAAVAALGVLGALTLRIVRFVRRVVHFLDDWAGEPARPGVPGRLGVLERLEQVEGQTRQLTPNGGAHLADAVRRVEQRVEQLAVTVAGHGALLALRVDTPTQIIPLPREAPES